MRPCRAVLAGLCVLAAGLAAGADTNDAAGAQMHQMHQVHVVAGAEDTLWSIAAAMPRGGATMAQAMEAIRRANPEAFVDGDIERLRAGARLRLPPLAGNGPGRAGTLGQTSDALATDDGAPAADAPGVAPPPAQRQAEPAVAQLDDLVAERNRLVAGRERLMADLAESRRQVSAMEEELAQARSAAARPRMPPERDPPSLVGRVALGAVLVTVGIVLGAAGGLAWRRGTEARPPTGGADEGAPGDSPGQDPGQVDGPVAQAPDAAGTERLAELAERVRAQPGAAPVEADRGSAAHAAPREDFDAAASGFEGDAVAVKLELARAYVDVDDAQSAREVLDEVRLQGDASQRAEALALLARL